jgi:autophagy-related protein 2
VLDFGVPQISIEVDGIQVQARLSEDASDILPGHTNPRKSTHVPTPSTSRDESSDTSSNADEHVPTVDELARSFMREEPAEEIQELAQELKSQSEYMQESMSSSDDGDDEAAAGIGSPLALPTYLRNILNTALDRLSLVINDIGIEVEDRFPIEPPSMSKSTEASPLSLNFHIERIAIDSITSQDSRVECSPAMSAQGSLSRSGKRRMRIESICARLVSDIDSFVSMSKTSRASSPETTRSETTRSEHSMIQRSQSELSMNRSPVQHLHETEAAIEQQQQQQQQQRQQQPNLITSQHLIDSSVDPPETFDPPVSASVASLQEGPAASLQEGSVASLREGSVASLREESIASLREVPGADPQENTSNSLASLSPKPHTLTASIMTVDDDRFADASSDDGQVEYNRLSQSRDSLPVHGISGSSILYEDDGILDYAIQHDMFDSNIEDDTEAQINADHRRSWNSGGAFSAHQSYSSHPMSENSISELPTVSALGRSFPVPDFERSPSQSQTSDEIKMSNDKSDVTQELTGEEPHLTEESLHLTEKEMSPTEDGSQSLASSTYSTASLPAQENVLSESSVSSQDGSESMYMSAVSATPAGSSRPHVPGGWDLSPTSSRDTASDTSGSIPEDMISGSILEPPREVEDGCDTPRPGSRQSTSSSPYATRPRTPTDHTGATQRQAKVFLTIDEVTVWFPLGLNEEETLAQSDDIASDASSLDFKPPSLGEDSIFAEMPGSFSNYAHSTSTRRSTLMDESIRNRPSSRQSYVEKPNVPLKQKLSPSVNVEVGSVVGHMDVSTGRIMFGMLDRVVKAFGNEAPQNKEEAQTSNPPANNTTSSLEISIKRVGIAWLENILAEPTQDERVMSHVLDSNPLEAILRINLSKLRATSQTSSKGLRSKLQIGNFVLSSLGTDLISFRTPKPNSRRSVSNVSEQIRNDVEIDYEEGTDKRVTVVTRPVKVMLDIQKLDEALGSFGGFSGVLELGNSISSNATVSSPVISPMPPKPRGVHFGDAPLLPVEPVPAASSMPKIQIQFGEVSFTLKGRSCAVQLQTTTVRVAVRKSNIRLKISEIQLSGPYVDSTQTGAPLLVEVRGTTVNFLYAPEETDLARLISLITPSKDPYESNEDILIETLLRQRRKGSVLRVEVSNIGVRLSDLKQMETFEALGAELARLSKVTKYLPDDDRPGLLTLALVQEFEAGIAINEKIGDISVSLKDASVAHVGVPALFAAEIGKAIIGREDDILVHDLVKLRPQDQLPMIMVRMVGDEMEPMVKIKLFNLCVEYRVSTIMAALGISEDGSADDIALGLASSVATITGTSSPKTPSRQSSQTSSPSGPSAKPLQIDLLVRNSAIGLNPRNSPSKGLFVLTEAHLTGKQEKDDYSIALELRRASIHAIDDIARLEEEHKSSSAPVANRHLSELHESGYVSLSSISAARVSVNIVGDGKEKSQFVDVEFKNELFVLESCADSTQTLIGILNGLQPPTPPSTAERYRSVVPLQQMMESFTGDAISALDDPEDDDFMSNADLVDDEVPANLEFVGSFYNPESLPTDEDTGDSMLGEDDLGALASSPVTRQRGERILLESFQEQYEVAEGEHEFDFSADYFKDSDSDHKGKARKWDSTKNQYHLTNEFKAPDAPLKVRVRDMNIIWNLYDGYDWPRTRTIITQAVDDVEARAEERRRKSQDDDEDDDFIEEDFLFNSVWIGVPVKEEKGALTRRINHDIDDLVSETGSTATSTATRSTGATARPRTATKSNRRRLKLERSKHKKIAFSLMGVAVDLIVFPPGTGETLNSVDVRVQDFEIFDHVPTSTWKKFITCAIEPSRREMDRPMINLGLLTVKPVTDLAASELVIKVSHVMNSSSCRALT